MTSGTHPAEPHVAGISGKLNWLRAGVLGANDGIVSTAGIVVGVAAASAERGPIFTAGIAGLAAGALSMAVGEYVSVSTQRYKAKGLSAETAKTVATELTENDAFAAHIDAELGIDPDDLTNPWQAAFSSAIAFTVGAVLPLLTILLLSPAIRIPVTFVSVLIALAITGWVSARLGGAEARRAILRVVVGGALAMAITFAIGHLVGGVVA